MRTTIDNKIIITPPIPYNTAIIIDGYRTYDIEIEIGQTDAGFIQNPINMEAKIFLIDGTYIILEEGVDYIATAIQNGLHIKLLEDIDDADYFIFSRRTRADFIIDFTQSIGGDNLKQELNNVLDITFLNLQELRLDADSESKNISNKVDKINISPLEGGSPSTIPVIVTNNQGQVLSIISVPIAISSDHITDLEETVENYSFIQAKADKTYVDEQDVTKINISEIGIPGGIAPVDLTGKIPANFLPTRGESLKGEYNILTNTPPLSDNDPNNKNGDYYKSIESGTRDFGSGPITLNVGDELMFSSDLGAFFKIPASSSDIISVNGKFGIVVLKTDDIDEGMLNLWFTASRARSSTLIETIDPNEDEKAPVSKVIYEALIQKSNLVSSAVENNILIVNNAGQPLDSGKKFDNDPTLNANDDNNIPTQKAVRTLVDNRSTTVITALNNKVDKINIPAVNFNDADSTFALSINEQGQVTQITETPIAISSTQITDFNNQIDFLIKDKVDKVIPTIPQSIAALNLDGSLYNTNVTIINDSEFENVTQNQVPTALSIKNYATPIAQKGVPFGFPPLDANKKVPNDYIYPLADRNYKGMWNAMTNTPVIVSGIGMNGDYYKVNVGGNTEIDGISPWFVGDEIVFNGELIKWERKPNYNEVLSVNGQTNDVKLTLDDIPDGLDRKLYTQTDFTEDFTNSIALYAPLNSPSFSGNPVSPTPDINNISNRIATTEGVYNIVNSQKKYGMDVLNRIALTPGMHFTAPTNGTIIVILLSTLNNCFAALSIDGLYVSIFGSDFPLSSARWQSASYPIAMNQTAILVNGSSDRKAWNIIEEYSFVPYIA